MSCKTKVATTALIMAAGLMAWCGYNFTQDDKAPKNAHARKIDIPSMKTAALSNLAGDPCVASAGNGCVAELTIDPTMQRIVYETLCRYADTNDTGVGWAVLMSVGDGAVLSLADCGGDAAAPCPVALTRMFMPGHLLSALTVAAAIDVGIATPGTELLTDVSEAFYQQYKLPGDGGHSWAPKITVSNALAHSSNIVLSKLGILVGREREYEALRRFGIGIRSGTGFPGESAGRLLPPERWDKRLATRLPIGMGVEVTSIQIARAYATLANRGVMVYPYIVKRIANASGETLYMHEAQTNKVQVVSRVTAESTCSILEGVVNADSLKGLKEADGGNPPDKVKSSASPSALGRRAAVDGVRIAGKTSTMQRMKPDSYEYYFDRYIASFAGFFPADAPKYVLVICYETKRVDGVPYIHQGGGRPAMAFAEVVRRMDYGVKKP